MVSRLNNRVGTEAAQVLAAVADLLGNVSEVRRRRAALTAAASAERERITVVVNSAGGLVQTIFGEDIEDLGYRDIARATITAAQQAAATVQQQAAELLKPWQAARAALPQLSDLVDGLPRLRDAIVAPPAAPLAPPGDRPAETGDAQYWDDDEYHDFPGQGQLERPEKRGAGSQSSALVAQFHDTVATITDAQQQRTALRGQGCAARRRVTVTVNADGIVIDIAFATDISDLEYDEIADAITEAAAAAAADVARQTSELFAPITAESAGAIDLDAAVAAAIDVRRQLC